MTDLSPPQISHVSSKLRDAYQDRSGKRPNLRETIRRMARAQFDLDWKAPISFLRPMILPRSKRDASVDQMIYAVHLLENGNPDLKIARVEPEMDLDVPSGLQRPTIDFAIDEDDWDIAYTQSLLSQKQETARHGQVTLLLQIFAEAACRGEVATFAWLGGDEEVIPKRRWNVNDTTLRSRYDSGELEQTGGPVEYLLPLILVDGEAAARLIKTLKMASPERERHVRERLRKAKEISNKIVPHGNMRRLKTDIAKFIPCSFTRAGVIVFEETGGCWSGKGRPNKTEIPQTPQIKITQLDQI